MRKWNAQNDCACGWAPFNLKYTYLSHKKSFHLGPSLCIEFHLSYYSFHFKIKVVFGHKPRCKPKVTFGEISLKLCQTKWNVARNQCKCCWWWTIESNNSLNLFNDWYLDSTASTHINAVLCALVPSARKWRASIENWRQKFLTLLWTPLARQKALNESYAMHAILC